MTAGRTTSVRTTKTKRQWAYFFAVILVSLTGIAAMIVYLVTEEEAALMVGLVLVVVVTTENFIGIIRRALAPRARPDEPQA